MLAACWVGAACGAAAACAREGLHSNNAAKLKRWMDGARILMVKPGIVMAAHIRACSFPMGTPAPERFCGVGRRRAKSRSRHYARALRRTHDAKAPGPSGCVRAGARFVAPLVRCTRIALRGAPGGSPRPHATQAVSIGKEHALDPARQHAPPAPPDGKAD